MHRLSALRKSLIHLRRDARGVSAVEFAFILPIMILLLLGTFDLTRAIDIKSRMAALSSTVSGFISQQKTISKTELANIVAAAKTVLQPYDDSSSTLIVEVMSIKTDAGSAKIDWSYLSTNSTLNAQDRTSTILPVGTSSIRTSVTYEYELKFTGYLFSRIGLDKITMNSEVMMAPRWGTPVTTTGS